MKCCVTLDEAGRICIPIQSGVSLAWHRVPRWNSNDTRTPSFCALLPITRRLPRNMGSGYLTPGSPYPPPPRTSARKSTKSVMREISNQPHNPTWSLKSTCS